MKILSLFDGISCARVACDRAGMKVDNYYASEIDKYAIQIAQKNYPDAIHIGDVKGLNIEDGWIFHNQNNDPIKNGGSFKADFDLLIGGSPCTDLSIAKKDRKGLEGERSSLFREYARILKEIKPKRFVLENVASMPKKDKDIITKELGVEPIMIDASLVSAQSRKRLFWTNIPGVTQPIDRKIMLKDILTGGGEEYIVQRGRGFNKGGEYREKSPTLSSCAWQENNKVTDGVEVRKLTPVECERLQSLPDGYTEGISNSQRYKCLGNAFCVNVVAHILSFIPLSSC